jgi:cobalamin biosynthesis Mg chelatase CobN
VMKTPSGDRLWRSDQVPTGTAVTMCDAAGVCTEESLSTGTTGSVSDYTIARTRSGWRAYFKKVDMASQTQGVYSAPTNASALEQRRSRPA